MPGGQEYKSMVTTKLIEALDKVLDKFVEEYGLTYIETVAALE